MLEAFLPSMIENNHGHVVALSSMAGVMGLRNLVPYCASKYAVRGLMEALNEELREDARQIEVKFTTIFPFIVDTGLCKKPHTRYNNSFTSVDTCFMHVFVFR
jgi:short-subunit dehydrogenase